MSKYHRKQNQRKFDLNQIPDSQKNVTNPHAAFHNSPASAYCPSINSQPTHIKCSFPSCNNTASLVQCLSNDCNLWFCNKGKVRGNNKSHILAHLQSINHNSIAIKQNGNNLQELKCSMCGCVNVFSLGILNGRKNEFVCRVPCLLNTKSESGSWEGLIRDNQIIIKVFNKNLKGNGKNNRKMPIGYDNGSRASFVTTKEVREMEYELLDLVPGVEPLKFLKIKRIYAGIEEYAATFEHLLMLEEAEEEILQKKCVFNDVILYFPEEGIRSKAYFHGTELGCKFTEKDELTVFVKNFNWRSSAKITNKINGKFFLYFKVIPFSGINAVTIMVTDENSVSERITKEINHWNDGSMDPDIRDIILGQKSEALMDYFHNKVDYSIDGNTRLNDFQNTAVGNAMRYKFSVIQGPPGTGKTQTIAAIVYHITTLCNHFHPKLQDDSPKSLAKPKKLSKKQAKVKEPDEAAAKIYIEFLTKTVSDLRHSTTTANKIRYEYYSEKLNKYLEKFNISAPETQSSKSASYDRDHRILVCAPSNIATRELRTRLVQSNLKVLQVFARSKEADYPNEPNSLHTEVKLLLENDPSYINLQNKKKILMAREEPTEDVDSQIIGKIRQAEKKILGEYNIICCTCMTSANFLFRGTKFQHVLIDEATQTLDPEATMCMMKGATHVVLIGDIKQLGVVVKSDDAKNLGLDVPMIERLSDLSIPMQMLKEQYRMDPLISEFPNQTFYNGELIDHFKSKQYKEFQFPTPVNSNTLFYDIHSIEEISGSGSSLVNQYEAKAISEIINLMQSKNVPSNLVGIIAFYDGQKGFLQTYLNKHCDVEYMQGVEVMSVDASQGREKGFIILSCIRANKNIGVGFLSDFRRLNVAMTRAQHGLIVCGNLLTLSSSPLYSLLLDFFNKKQLIFTGQLNNLQRVHYNPPQNLKLIFKRPNKYQDD